MSKCGLFSIILNFSSAIFLTWICLWDLTHDEMDCKTLRYYKHDSANSLFMHIATNNDLCLHSFYPWTESSPLPEDVPEMDSPQYTRRHYNLSWITPRGVILWQTAVNLPGCRANPELSLWQSPVMKLTSAAVFCFTTPLATQLPSVSGARARAEPGSSAQASSTGF